MATINDVAQAASVSIATVSRVINNSFMVTQEKRQRVLAAMTEVGYQPNQHIRSPKSAKGKIILVVSSILVEDLFSGIQSAANDLGYNVLFDYIGDSSNGYKNSLDILPLLQNTIGGIILVNTIYKLKELNAFFDYFPVVQVGESYYYNPSYIVSTDDKSAAYDMTNLLIRKGKKRIAFMATERPEESKMEFCYNRAAGYRQALADSHIDVSKELIVNTDYSIEGGREGTKKLLALQERPDAIFCASDIIAAGCIKQLKLEGISIPGEISVSGFDNLPMAESCSPGLTTVAQSFEDIGIEAVRTLDMLIGKTLSKGRKIYINYEILEREST